MKITHLTSVHPPDDNRIFKMCRSIVGANRAVSFIVPAEEDCVVDSVEIKAVPRASSRLQRMLRTVFQVYRRAVEEQADIYQFHDPELIPVGLALRWFSKSQVIYDVHENVSEQMLTKAYIPTFLRKAVAAAYDGLEGFSVRQFSAIVTANEDINERFLRVSGRIAVIHNYADDQEFSDIPESNAPRYSSGLVFHCAASERTSFPAVLRALEFIPKEVGIRLLVTGCTADEADEAARVIEQSRCQRVESLGLLPRHGLREVFSRCAVSIVLYNEPRNHSGIRANRFYESLAAAAPVITPDFPEWRASVESIGCGLSVDPTDPRAIADALQFLLSHPEEAAAMGKRGRHAFLKTFKWTREKEKLLELYDELLNEGLPISGVTAT